MVRYDARGFGQSTDPGEPFAHHEDLRGLMTALGIDQATLIGCSGGGAACVDFALTYPALTDALVLVGSGLNGVPLSGDPPSLMLRVREAMERGDLDAAVEYGLQLWTDGSRRPHDVNQAVRERTRQIMTDLWSREQTLAENPPARPPAAERLAEIAVPTLAIVGDADVSFIHQIADLVAAQVHGARKVVIDDAGHHPIHAGLCQR